MSSDRLREAARVLRERAEAATPGPWEVDQSWATIASGPHSVMHGYYVGACQVCGEQVDEDASVAISGDDADYIATMHPGVGLALADWLDAEGKVYYTPNSAGQADGVTRSAHVVADLILGGAS